MVLKFTAQSKDLQILKHLAVIAKSNKIQPALQCVNLTPVSSTKLEIWATDLDITISSIVPATITEHEKLSLNAQKLYQLVGTMDGLISFNDTTLKSKNKNGKITGKIDSKMNYKDVVGTEYIVDAKKFINQLRRTVYACASTDMNNILSGVLIDGAKLVASDGRILVVNNLDSKILDKQIILPSLFVDKLINIFVDNETLTLTTDGTFIKVADGTTTITSRLLEGTYFKYTQLISTIQSANVAVIDRLALLDALSFADTMINIRTNIVKLQFTKGSQLEISTNSEDGESNATIDIEHMGDDMLIAFNAQYLNKILKSYNSATVEIGMNSALSATLITDGVSEDVALIMPIKVATC